MGLFVYDNVRSMYVAEHGFTLNNYLKDPQRYGGGRGQRFGKVINTSQDHFYFDLGDSYIKVIGSGVKKSIYGETVIFINFRKDGIIELIDYHNYDYNYLLYLLSFIALVIFLIIFFREWRLTFRREHLFDNKYS